ncbi:MAG: hypothetical protein M0015_10405 [Betaproteobacteria bacterium]|nr:hypothetical protein [Betaproteobacteria bacterium]
MRERFAAADSWASGAPLPTQDDHAAQAHWLIDPQGILWEARLASDAAAAPRADGSADAAGEDRHRQALPAGHAQRHAPRRRRPAVE